MADDIEDDGFDEGATLMDGDLVTVDGIDGARFVLLAIVEHGDATWALLVPEGHDADEGLDDVLFAGCETRPDGSLRLWPVDDPGVAEQLQVALVDLFEVEGVA